MPRVGEQPGSWKISTNQIWKYLNILTVDMVAISPEFPHFTEKETKAQNSPGPSPRPQCEDAGTIRI